MKNIVAGLLCTAACVTQSYALEINVTPGLLDNSKLLLANTRDAELTLTGSASAKDLDMLKYLSPSIKRLDMSNLSVMYDAVPDAMLVGSGIEQVLLPDNLVSIGRSAFASSSLTSVDIPASVKKIGDTAFAACPNLKRVAFDGNPELGCGVFKGAPSLEQVVFGEGVTVIPDNTFENCTLYAQSVPGSVTEIGAYAYAGTAIKGVDFSGVSRIGDFAFADCLSLSEVVVDCEHEMSVGKGAFFADSAIGVLPDMYGFYPQLVMAGSAGRDQLSVNGGSIDEAAFANNHAVKTLRIGPDVVSIKAYAFRNMTSLETVNVTPLSDKVPDTDEDAFSGLANEQGRYDILLHVEKNTSDVWKQHPVWRLFNIVDGGADVGSIAESVVNVGIDRSAESITVRSSMPVEMLGVYTLDGTILHESEPGVETCAVSGLPSADVLLVKVVSGGKIKIFKLR